MRRERHPPCRRPEPDCWHQTQTWNQPLEWCRWPDRTPCPDRGIPVPDSPAHRPCADKHSPAGWTWRDGWNPPPSCRHRQMCNTPTACWAPRWCKHLQNKPAPGPPVGPGCRQSAWNCAARPKCGFHPPATGWQTRTRRPRDQRSPNGCHRNSSRQIASNCLHS